MCAKFRLKQGSLRSVTARVRAATLKKQKQLATALAAWADDTNAAVQSEIQRVGAFDQGLLFAAQSRTPVTLQGTKLRVTCFNPLEYASVIEFGRRPRSGGPPPLLPLVGWAGRRGIISALPRNVSFGGEWAKAWAASAAILQNMQRRSGKAKSAKAQPLDPIIRDMLIVRLIARSIFEEGTVGRHPFAAAWDRRAPRFARDLASLVSSLA